jgi:hypothetical protein
MGGAWFSQAPRVSEKEVAAAQVSGACVVHEESELRSGIRVEIDLDLLEAAVALVAKI